jgi:type IV pilus assembly protein PilC
MLNAGVTLIQSLEMIGQGHAKASMRKMVGEITNEVRSGNPLSASLRKYPLYFDDLYCDLVETGEQSGSLETIYERIAVYKEKAEALKSKIKKAMFYPIAVLVVAFIVTVILLVFVVPQFESIFAGFGAELPAFTQMVLGISKFVQNYGIFIGIGMGIAGFLFVRAHRASPKLRDSIDSKSLKIPVIGEILIKASIARFSRTLSTTFAAGVPLIGALESSAGASGNAVYRDAILYMRKEVSAGIPMHTAMRATQVFPSMVVQMVSIGEESGSVDEMLSKIATIYEAEVDDMVDGLTSLLEPMIMAVLGVVIGGLIIAMYLPIFAMGAVV